MPRWVCRGKSSAGSMLTTPAAVVAGGARATGLGGGTRPRGRLATGVDARPRRGGGDIVVVVVHRRGLATGVLQPVPLEPPRTHQRVPLIGPRVVGVHRRRPSPRVLRMWQRRWLCTATPVPLPATGAPQYHRRRLSATVSSPLGASTAGWPGEGTCAGAGGAPIPDPETCA